MAITRVRLPHYPERPHTGVRDLYRKYAGSGIIMKDGSFCSRLRLSKNSVLRNKCRGEHCSSAEKQSFSGFVKGNSPVFRLAATDFALQNLRTTDGRPYEWLF